MKLRLRKIVEEDLELIANWRMSPEVTKYMYTDPIITKDSQFAWYKSIISDEKVRYWLVEFDKVKIGVFYLTNIDTENKRCYWGYYIGDTSFRGKGIARELECNIYDYVFFKLKLNKLCVEVLAFNEKVVKIHEKYGSEVEGVLKQHIFKNGCFYDVVAMGITKDRWKKIKESKDYEDIYIENY